MAIFQYEFDIQKFLKGFQTIETANRLLQQKFHVNVGEQKLEFGDGTTETVWVYNYDFLKARGDSRVENESRGLILNKKSEIVSMSFPRFFNANESFASLLDWESTNAEFKHNGTLIVVYAYRNNYFIQTRSQANAEGFIVGYGPVSYYDAVLNFLRVKFGDPFKPFREANEDDKYTWVFEYVSPYNRILTPYKEENLILLSAFNKKVYGEVKPEYIDQFSKEFGFDRPKYKMVHSMKDVHNIIDELGPMDEGVVLVDRFNRRVKVKNPAYLSINRAVNLGKQVRPHHFAAVVLQGDGYEIASYFPQYKDILFYLQEVLEETLKEIDMLWFVKRHLPSKKQFAEAVKHVPMKHLLFLAWDEKIKDMSDAIKHISSEHLVAMAEVYHPKEYKRAYDSARIGQTEEERYKDDKHSNMV